MFLAPFGMLISKYATIRALLDARGIPGGGVFLAVILAFGSAPTLFFWAKWMGKLVGGLRKDAEPSGRVPGDEWLALGLLSLFTFFACVFFSPMANHAIDPYVEGIYQLRPGIESDTLIAMTVMMALLFLMPLLYLVVPIPKTYAPGYLAGVNIDGSASYRGAMGATRTVESRNYYLTGFLSESRLTWAAYGISLLLILGMFIVI
jgi:ech hydrogenase subunit A